MANQGGATSMGVALAYREQASRDRDTLIEQSATAYALDYFILPTHEIRNTGSLTNHGVKFPTPAGTGLTVN